MKSLSAILFTLLICTLPLCAQTQSDTVNAEEEDVTPPPALPVDPDTAVFSFVHEMPSFGTEAGAFMKYINSAIRYPQKEKEENREGTVYVTFIVEKDGYVTNCRIAKGVPGAPGLDKEALRVMSMSPRWNPGKMNGKPVRVSMTMPVKFTLY